MRNQAEAERRVRILAFWEHHGTDAAKEAFGISRRTLFRWSRALAKGEGKLPSLDPKSTAPKQRRTRNIPPGIETFIIQERRAHPHLGKKKLAALLRAQDYPVSESYVGRVLDDLKRRNLLPPSKRLSFYAKSGALKERTVHRRKKLRRTQKRGMELDTVVRFIDGMKRYILTAIDVERKFAFAGAYTNHSSESAADFLRKLIQVSPFSITELQTDNGSEFALRFEEACRRLGLTHFHTYPRMPKMNPFIERFNRTLSEDFVEAHRGLLRDDPARFNDKLVEWLVWYNTVRPHESLGMISPLRYIVTTLSTRECQRYWTSTTN